jgi:hypothetical protein
MSDTAELRKLIEHAKRLRIESRRPEVDCLECVRLRDFVLDDLPGLLDRLHALEEAARAVYKMATRGLAEPLTEFESTACLVNICTAIEELGLAEVSEGK